jgi:hypothetical protein
MNRGGGSGRDLAGYFIKYDGNELIRKLLVRGLEDVIWRV